MSITTEEKRQAMKAEGWFLTGNTPNVKRWQHPATHMTLRIYTNRDGEVSRWAATPYQGYVNADEMPLLMGALSILQIPIPGYRIIREEGAEGGS